MIIRSYFTQDYNKSNWSGGTTTELFIYPGKSQYQLRDFKFRLSSAQVDLEKTTFTSLPGIDRKIMVLDGNLNIHHENHHSKQLNLFEQDSFSGSWNTSSIGKCTDFNLMMQEGTSGQLKHYSVLTNQTIECKTVSNTNWVLLYLYRGNLTITIEETSHQLNQGNLLVLSHLSHPTLITISGKTQSDLIITSVHCTDQS